ncbi:hypothetical protein HOM98_01780 [Candidatus Peregrinibacteria bacterium]|nr:hypothetical protein [Candidatus Peregrinibacteria bacterium]
MLSKHPTEWSSDDERRQIERDLSIKVQQVIDASDNTVPGSLGVQLRAIFADWPGKEIWGQDLGPGEMQVELDQILSDVRRSEVMEGGEFEEIREWKRRKSLVSRVSESVHLRVVNKVLIAAIMALVSTIVVQIYGKKSARDAVESSAAKTAVSLVVHDPDLEGQPIGYIYGARAGADELRGIDRSIPVPPEMLEQDGSLWHWYQGLVMLEDRGHEGGWSDFTGVNPTGIARAVLSLGESGGGSTLADQACGQLRAGTNGYEESSRWERKLLDTTCGIGMANLYTPEEIAAHYATFGYLGPKAQGVELFARLYWGFEGVEDSRMTIGHQLVLAAMVRYTWDSTQNRWDDPGSHNDIVGRASYALDLLIEKGVIFEKDREEIQQQILAAKPRTKSDVGESRRGFSVAPTAGYDYAIVLAIEEARQRFGDNWREVVKSIFLTIDPNVQGTAVRSSKQELGRLETDKARSIVVVVDSEGRIIAAHAGDENGFDGIGGMDANQSVGSVGKLLLASSVAGKGLRPGHKRASDFRDDLRMSRSDIIREATAVGASQERAHRLMNCYGQTHADSGRNWFRDAALGVWDPSPRTLLPFMEAAKNGQVMPSPHVVQSFEMRNGTVVTPELHFEYPNGEDSASSCARLAHANGATSSWLAVPLEKEGTLEDLNGLIDGGKTGTVEPVRNGRPVRGATNMAWVLGYSQALDSNAPNGYTILAGLMGDDLSVNLGNDVSGGDNAAGIVRRVSLTLRDRSKKKMLLPESGNFE